MGKELGKKKTGQKKTLGKKRLLKQQIVNLESQEIVWALRKVQQRVFEGANKPGKYLAYILKKKREHKIINKISEEGKELIKQESRRPF